MIEAARKEDFSSIAKLNVKAYEEFATRLLPGSWDAMQKNLQNIEERTSVSEFLVVRIGGEIVGSVAYGPPGSGDPSIFEPDMASILLLAVHPQHRGKGIAKELTAACIARARNDKAASIGLFTSELMQSAQYIYRSLGFQQEAELPMRHGVRYFRFVLSLVRQNRTAANDSLQAPRP
ncbi:MAG: GNAT family N-acetyltransferase [Gallionella sp.]